MELLIYIFLCCLVLGSIVGILAGLLGIGGGLIIVPALVFVFTRYMELDLNHAMPMAIATSLSTIIFTAWSSARAHYRLGHLDKRIVTRCAFGISVGAIVGAQLASHLPGESVKSIFAILVLIVCAQMMFGRTREHPGKIGSVTLIIIGMVTGLLSAFMGIGGGAILVPILMFFGVALKSAIGCAALCGMVIALFGTGSFIQAGWAMHGLPLGTFGYVYLPAALGVVLTSVFTARIGARISGQMNVVMLKRVFAGFLFLVSMRMLLG